MITPAGGGLCLYRFVSYWQQHLHLFQCHSAPLSAAIFPLPFDGVKIGVVLLGACYLPTTPLVVVLRHSQSGYTACIDNA